MEDCKDACLEVLIEMKSEVKQGQEVTRVGKEENIVAGGENTFFGIFCKHIRKNVIIYVY